MFNDLFSVADIPGLIEGAHEGKGMGIDFLKHIERCMCLLYIIDLTEPEPWRQLEILEHELREYKDELVERPFAVVGNKIDVPEAQVIIFSFSHLNKKDNFQGKLEVI